MKRLLMITIILFAAAGTVQLLADWDDNDGYGRRGYGHHGYGRHGYGYVYMLRDELKLTDAQFDKVKDIAESYGEKRYKARGDYDRMVELRDAEFSEIEKVLTAQQKERYTDLFDDDGYGPGYCHGGGRGWGRR